MSQLEELKAVAGGRAAAGMTTEQEQHLKRIKDDFTTLVDSKYRAGQREHGGDLFTKPVQHLLDSAIDEAIDQVVYLLSLREHIYGVRSW